MLAHKQSGKLPPRSFDLRVQPQRPLERNSRLFAPVLLQLSHAQGCPSVRRPRLEGDIAPERLRRFSRVVCLELPFIDLAAVTGIQIKMLYEMSKVYGIEFRKNRVKSVVAALVGGAAPGPIGSTFKLIPGIGSIVGSLAVPVFAGASTYAVGKVFIEHFEAGGTFLNFDPSAVRDYFMQEFEKGKEVAQEAAGEINKESAKVAKGPKVEATKA